jgi:hypothetical protein
MLKAACGSHKYFLCEAIMKPPDEKQEKKTEHNKSEKQKNTSQQK